MKSGTASQDNNTVQGRDEELCTLSSVLAVVTGEVAQSLEEDTAGVEPGVEG